MSEIIIVGSPREISEVVARIIALATDHGVVLKSNFGDSFNTLEACMHCEVTGEKRAVENFMATALAPAESHLYWHCPRCTPIHRD